MIAGEETQRRVDCGKQKSRIPLGTPAERNEKRWRLMRLPHEKKLVARVGGRTRGPHPLEERPKSQELKKNADPPETWAISQKTRARNPFEVELSQSLEGKDSGREAGGKNRPTWGCQRTPSAEGGY